MALQFRLGLLSERRIRAGFTHLNHIAAYGTDITPISIETVLLNCFFFEKEKGKRLLACTEPQRTFLEVSSSNGRGRY